MSKSYFDKAFVLTRPAINPRHDRRARYGSAAIPFLPAGTVIFYFEPAGPYSYGTYYDEKGGSLTQANTEFGKEIAKHAKPYKLQTWRHVLVFNFGEIYSAQLGKIFDDLLETGSLSIDQLMQAAQHVHDQDTEPAEKSS